MSCWRALLCWTAEGGCPRVGNSAMASSHSGGGFWARGSPSHPSGQKCIHTMAMGKWHLTN